MPAFDGARFLPIGIRVSSTEANEAGYRTAISRVYYACHLVGRDATAKKGWFRPTYSGRDHSGLYRVLRGRYVPWAEKLRDLLRLREHADYHTDPNALPADSPCTHCQSTRGKDELVDPVMWEMAKDIAEDILPRLQAIFPR